VAATLPRRQPGATTDSSGLFDFGDAPRGPRRRGPTPDGDSRRSRRRRDPALDGLRGLAVAVVVLYHAGVPGTVGGYLGVDAFFVLSGFLITRLLLDEWDRRGGIDLPAFWGRRIRRLLPAALVVLAGVAALCLVLDPTAISTVRGDALATLGYAMNWRLISESSSYFDQFAVSPLRHAWSLAVEEQFYLLWPLALLGLKRLGVSARGVFVTTVGLAAASAAWMAVNFRPDVDPSRLYYGTDTRAQSVLIGAALAAALAAGLRIAPGRSRRALLVAGTVAAAGLAVAWARLPGTAALLYRGGFTVLAVAVAVVILAATHAGDNPLRRGLSWRPLRALGLVSYAVYLYHLPIFIWLNADRTGLDPHGPGLLALRLAATGAAAVASWLVVERPVLDDRRLRAHTTAALRPALAPAAIVVTLALLGMATTRATPGVAQSLAAGRDPGAPAPATGDDGHRVLLVGDSVAYSLGVGLEGTVSTERSLAVWNDAALFCELLPYPRFEDGQQLPASRTCDGWDARWRRDVADFGPRLTVLQVGAWEIFDRMVDGRVVVFGSAEADRLLDDVLDRAVAALGSTGAPVAVVTTPPLRRDDGTNAREWTQNESARTDHFNDRLRALAARWPAGVRVVDLAAWLCPGNVCRPEIEGARIRPDGVHFGPADSPVVARWLADRLHELL
jgi:peptidoglycan/LPS O-acetylase OafA/YrhL/lysophospholipase L1-like esterase